MTIVPFENIMVGLAGAGTDAGLLRYASALAQVAPPRAMHFVHVLTPGGANATTFVEERGRLREAIDEVFRGTTEGGPRLYDHLLRGERIDSLLEFAAGDATDLILIGHRRGRSGRRSLARRLAMKAPCSVWMAPEGSEPDFERILVPIDFSEPAADALTQAAALAARAGAREVFALHVFFNEATVSYEGYDEVFRDDKEEAFARFIAPLDLHGVEVRPLFAEGANVARTILREAEGRGTGLIVMGTRGRSRSAAVMLGSETEHTIIESPIPVLAVKHFGARLNLLQALLDRRFVSRSGTRYSSFT
jgi:nucleotide-binding universal stress UspA family protein